MKYYETKFEDYIQSYLKTSLHTKSKALFKKFPDNVKDLPNLIFYGPEGVGKYTQALASIYKYSPSKFNYEKKICITFNKQTHYMKISDIHFEIDMNLLGCNTKILWNEMFSNIIDIILAKTDSVGIILCKNFQDVSNELLDAFYSYMQTNLELNITIIFVLITTQLSFIPDSIIERSKVINVQRPSRTQYNKCIKSKIAKDIPLNNITNIKDLSSDITILSGIHHKICNTLVYDILNIDKISYLTLRENIYDILIYNIGISKCIMYIIDKLVKDNKIEQKDVSQLFYKTVSFLQFYNNNYRPIYHLESYILYLSAIVHGYKDSV